ncbi:Spy/CpxP family protein refolding chaperone [Blastopirellula marina]|uniref:Uncharacterized protein n=1 Tax=Blastopirellula marina DSM 3645 TaxID=314230 RepID=A3ZLT6_9BACT|nr:Spy/CpxP family protein refolding chaperone [Blastopirellula marina]EAQ82719.1 hypothetical protein DSM3645_09977 [Blastopirellula marina DSM 3645]
MNVWKNQWLAGLAAVCLIAAMAQISVAQGPGGRGGRGAGGFGGANSSMLLGTEQVQTLLKLTDEQKAEIKTITDESRSAMREMFQGGGDDTDRAAMREKMTKMAAETSEKVGGVLTAAQKSQLVGILLKTDLGSALNDSMVKSELGVTEEQSKKIAAARETANAELRGSFQGMRDASPEERREMMAKMTEARTAAAGKVKEELTAEQIAKIEKLTAIDFELDRSQMRGGQRGQQGQRGQRGQGGQRGQRGNNNSAENDDDAI